MTSNTQRSNEEIVAWNLRKITTGIRRFAQSMKEIWARAETKELDVRTAGPVLNDMLMSVDLLQQDANALLQPHQINIEDTWCQTEFKTCFDSFLMKEAKELKSAQTQTVLDQSGTTCYKELDKRLNKIEQTVMAQNLMERLCNVEQNQKADKTINISKRLELIENLKLPADLPKRIQALESDVCPDILRRVDTLKNHLTEVKQCVFGHSSDVKNMDSCIVTQLFYFKETLDEGNNRLQAIEDKLEKQHDMLGSSRRELPIVEESQSIPKKAKQKGKEYFGDDKNEATATPKQVQTSDGKCITFQVCLDCEGDWPDGTVMNKAKIGYNHGNAFCEQSARFIAPVDGLYTFHIWVKRGELTGEEAKVEVWRCRKNRYIGRMIYSYLSPSQLRNSFRKDKMLPAGENLVVRVFGAKGLQCCIFEGSLLNP